MEATSLESLLQAAAVDQLLGYNNNQNAVGLLQQVSALPAETNKGYPAAYLDALNTSQTVPNVDDSGFGDGIDLNDGFVNGKYILRNFFKFNLYIL